ncbi:sensor histidine kinase NtrY-like [Paracraurococcus ruber]|uniref:histidine kinase n=1 Tax=Paracraurococcus ruber TaxID=77675 RepID=A0ABS1CZA2_9PROT|nr:PAS domain-containing sensor histidine kinase [Paracraurococcus ruber]MBK1659656.1 two-component sensor histidine kinase [Paracraurococcus ruber]TDG30669.1 PAS domain-containing sensor histidine kinase [Paracraurococcus ruber]
MSDRRRLGRRIADALLGRGMTLGLAVGALLLGIATFAVLSNASPFGPTRPGVELGLMLVSVLVIALLGASLAGRLVRVWAERRRGSAGARLHVRLVLLFGVVSVVPAILVAGFAAAFFNLGIQAWFGDRVRTALEASRQVAQAYLEEHRNNIRGDALAMANDLNRAGSLLLTDQGRTFAQVLATHTLLRGLTEAVVFDPTLRRPMAQYGPTANFELDPPPDWAIDMARQGEVAVLPDEQSGRVRAVVALDSRPLLMLLIGRPVDPEVVNNQQRAEREVEQYEQLDRNRYGLQVTFVMIFAIAALLVLLAAVLIGLVIANQIARPIGRLIVAAERVRAGDLATRVEEAAADEELSSLTRAFNRMTNQLAAQRSELMQAYRQIDDRRRFTEAVLAGVSAGVVGLEPDGRINLPNRRASELLGLDLDAAIGLPLGAVVPEFAPLLLQVGVEAGALPDRGMTAEVRIGPPSNRRTLLAQVGAELQPGPEGAAAGVAGYVVTFDDITELLSAQRKAAWADVARRIAHEIKNPLTPIQLSAERLKRRYLKEIQSDPETFKACTDTIVRQVGDIGRMVDEFSAFARMPQPVIRPEDLAQVVREALVLQRDAHPEIEYRIDLPEAAPMVPCDRRLLGQALTNLLQNAADAVSMRVQAEALDAPAGAVGRASGDIVGHISVRIEPGEDMVAIAVEDDGVGLPQGDERERLAEPYVTHKAKGTGLGLAIVKKIMEDHGGRLGLEDRSRAPGEGPAGSPAAGPGTGPGADPGADPGAGDAPAGARAVLTLPWRPAQDRSMAGDNDRPDGSMRRAHGA